MAPTIVIAGFTGRMARLTTEALLSHHPDVNIRGIARSPEKVDTKISASQNVTVFAALATDKEAIRAALRGASICICCYLGDHALMVDGQKLLIDACIAEGVKRYIASDWSIDYRPLAFGDLPAKDPMKHIQAYLAETEKKGKIKAIHIFNGAFTEVVFAPFIGWFHAEKGVFCYWGTGDEPLEMTSFRDAAAYTAEVAVDPTAHGVLNFRGDRKSIKQLAHIYEKVYGVVPKIQCLGSLTDLNVKKQEVLKAQPQNTFAWLGYYVQYVMGNGSTLLGPLDNERYPSIKPKTVEEFMKEHTKDTIGNSMMF